MSSDEILNIKEVSNYLKIPVSTIYKLTQDKRVPTIKLGKHCKFMKKIWIDSSQVEDPKRLLTKFWRRVHGLYG